MFSGHQLPGTKEHYDENTLFKVYDALREDGGLTEKQTRSCITAMQNRGILFRENVQASPPDGPLLRGAQKEGESSVQSFDPDSEPVAS